MSSKTPKSELTVVTKSQELCSYVLLVTTNSPKKFRFTLVSKLQNISLEVIQSIFKANEIYLNDPDRIDLARKRLDLQREAMTGLKVLDYMSLIAREQNCILPKQYEQITKQSFDCKNLLGAWMKSDKKRHCVEA